VSDFDRLSTEVLAAQACGDHAQLVQIYGTLGHAELALGHELEGAYFLTQAYVYALEGGLPEQHDIHKTLVAYGREE